MRYRQIGWWLLRGALGLPLACGGVTRNDPRGSAAAAGTNGGTTEPSIPPSPSEDPSPVEPCQFEDNIELGAAVRATLGVSPNAPLDPIQLDEMALLETTGLWSLKGIECLRNLRILSTPYGTITELWPVGYLKELVELDVSSNRVPDLQALTQLPRLELVDASHNDIRDLSRLQMLELKELRLSGNAIERVGGSISMPKLVLLDLSNNGLVSSADFQYFGTLQTLSVNDNPFDFSSSGQLNELRSLDASHTSLSSLTSLPGGRPLDFLDISFTLVSSLAALTAWPKDDGVCKHINLEGLALDTPSQTLAKEGFCTKNWELLPFCPARCDLK